MTGRILTCNAGSSNTKLAVFDAATGAGKAYTQTQNEADTLAWLRSVGGKGISAIGHRVVHGGREFTKPAHLTPKVIATLKTFIPLAPLHQPAALKLIEAICTLYPDVPQIACFDTAFHHTTPELGRRLPLPGKYYDSGIIRYGFHGLSYQHIAAVLPKVAGKRARGRMVVAHLGGGASMCAMKDLKSIASTMGFSTLDGLMMGTRCGALDPGAILYLLQQEKMTLAAVENLLYRESGLKGVSGISGEMRELEHSRDKNASMAIELFCYLAAKQLGGLLMALGGLDALVFTGGIGEHSSRVRATICEYLAWLGVRISARRNEQNASCISTSSSAVFAYVIPTDEESVIVDACRAYLS